MKRTRAQAGRYAKAVGDSFETWLDAQHMMARNEGMIACVHHNEPKTAYIKGILTFTKKSVADYSGTLEGGRSLAEETKSTGDERFPFNDISLLQVTDLDAVARAGGLALLVLEFRRRAHPFFRRFAVPWLQVPWKVSLTAKSVGPDELLEWEIKPGTCYMARFHEGGPPSSPHTFKRYARD